MVGVAEDEGGVPAWVVIGKILHRRVLHVNTIEHAWGNPEGLTFILVVDNMFVANF